MSRRLTTVRRICQYGVNNFTRNAWLTTAATAVMTITLLIMVISFIMSQVFEDTITEVRKRINVSIYLKDEVTNKQRSELETAIRQIPIVTDVVYISKDQAKKEFESQNKTNQETLEGLAELQENPFPASLRVSTNDPTKLNQVSDLALSDRFKDLLPLPESPPSNAGERREAIDRIASWSNTFQIASLTATIVFVVISMLIIFNTIRMAIYNRREEIQMMRLIGADPSFIRGPFIVEAALYGVLAAVISSVLLYIVILTQGAMFESYQQQQIQVLQTVDFFKTWPVLVVPTLIVVGVAIGVISSLFAMRRYLRDRR